MLKDTEYWNIIIDAFIALGTVGAVLYALYRDLFKRPKLSIELDIIESEFRGAKKHFRIIVRNKRKATAKDCVLQVEELIDFKSGISPAFYEPLLLEWRSSEIIPNLISNGEVISTESLQRKVDIPPKGHAKARFVAVEKDNNVFLRYDVKPTEDEIHLFPTDRSVFLNQWLVEANSRIGIRLVAYAENADPVTAYCLLEKDSKGILNAFISTKRPKIK